MPIRPSLLAIALAIGAGAGSAAAQQSNPVVTEAQRIRTIVVYGNDPCPRASNPDEIIVCARRPEEERFRLPQNLRNEATRSRTTASWAARQRELTTIGDTGIGSCTPVGPGGDTGCFLQQIRPE